MHAEINSRPPLTRFQVLARIVAILVLAFLAIQFIRPKITNPPVTADLQAPPEVKQILKTSCYNCHSNETALPWFDKLAPAYWLVVKDVRSGRRHLNFSDLDKLPPAQQRAALYESISQIELGAMPLPAYQRIHPESVITPEQLTVLKNYLLAGVSNTPATLADTKAADAQYDKWIQSANTTPSVSPAPNGVAFFPDYKNWKAISSTERFDNHTMRVILGNNVAVQAIAENHINPWPDGSAFAKVAWLQQRDDHGLIQPGPFFQVEFMIRDTQKYSRTLGWGWARWRGADLKPYGKDASFTAECVGCHKPLASTNFVFTSPIRGQQ
jgi:hypothetical protein